MRFVWSDSYPIVKRPGSKCPPKRIQDGYKSDRSKHFRRWSGPHSRWNWTSVNASGCCKYYSSQNVKIMNVWERVISYMTLKSDMTALMQHASPRTSSWASLQQAATNETERRRRSTQSSSLKVVRQTYLSSADATRSLIAVFDLEMSWQLIKCSAYLLIWRERR